MNTPNFIDATARLLDSLSELDRDLIAFGDSCEDREDMTSLYYRLLPEIIEARARAAKLNGGQS